MISDVQVTYVKGHGKVAGPNTVTVEGRSAPIQTENILIATGSEPMPFPGLPVLVDCSHFIDHHL